MAHIEVLFPSSLLTTSKFGCEVSGSGFGVQGFVVEVRGLGLGFRS